MQGRLVASIGTLVAQILTYIVPIGDCLPLSTRQFHDSPSERVKVAGEAVETVMHAFSLIAPML